MRLLTSVVVVPALSGCGNSGGDAERSPADGGDPAMSARDTGLPPPAAVPADTLVGDSVMARDTAR